MRRRRTQRSPVGQRAPIGSVDVDAFLPDDSNLGLGSIPEDGEGLSEEEVRDAAFGGARWLGLTQSLGQVITLAAGVLLARLISPADFGRLAVAVIASELSLMTAHETIGTPLVQRAKITREHLQGATLAGLLLGLGLALLTLFVLPFITTPLFGAKTSALFRLFAIQFAITGVMIVPFAQLQRQLRFRRIGVSEVSAGLTSSIVAVGLAAAGLGAKAYVLGSLAGAVVMCTGFATATGLVLPRWRPKEMRELLGFGVPASAAGFAQIAYRNVDYAILGARLPATIVGYYYRAFTVGVEYERRLSAIVARIAFPIYTRTEDPARRLMLRLRIVRTNVVLVYPMLTLFIALAPSLVPWLFGPRWVPAVVPAQILAIAGMASCVRNLHSPTVLAAGHPRAMSIFSIIEAVLYGVSVLVASSYGLTVVCIVVSAFQVASLLLAYVILLHVTADIPRTQILHDLGPAVLASVPLLIVAAAIRHAIDTDLPVLLMAAVAGAGGGAAYLLALRAVSKTAWGDVAILLQRVLPGVSQLSVRIPSFARAHKRASTGPHRRGWRLRLHSRTAGTGPSRSPAGRRSAPTPSHERLTAIERYSPRFTPSAHDASHGFGDSAQPESP